MSPSPTNLTRRPTIAKLVAHATLNGRFTLSEAGPARRHFLLREVGQKAVIRIAERLPALAPDSNFGDIDGYAAPNGKHVRWGMIYRSEATSLLTDDGRSPHDDRSHLE